MNKSFFNIVLWVLVLSCIALCIYVISTRDKIGYIRSDALYSQYLGYKDAGELFNSKKDGYTHVSDSLKLRLQVLIASFRSDSARLSVSERNTSTQEIQSLYSQIQKVDQVIDNKLGEADQSLTEGVAKQVATYVEDYGVKNGYDYIFISQDGGDVLFASKANNITQDLLNYMNERYKKGK